jgi:hypothetical protein
MRAMLVGFWVYCSECSTRVDVKNGMISPGAPFPGRFQVRCTNPKCKEFDKWYWMQTPAQELKVVP